MNRENLRVVIRHLPPTMSESEFTQAIAPLPSHDNFYYVSGSGNKPHSFSRGYIRFFDSTQLRNFAHRFDNYVFIDAKGHEYTAQVEFAPFRGVTLKTSGRRRDPLMGTIENQTEYLDFVKKINDSALPLSKISPEVQSNPGKKDQEISTPLVDFVKTKKLLGKCEDKKIKKYKYHRRFLKEAPNQDKGKEPEESKSASSFFSVNSNRKFKSKKRSPSKGDSVDSMAAPVSQTGGDESGTSNEPVIRGKIQTDCVRKALGFPLASSSSSPKPMPRRSETERTQSIKSYRGGSKVIDATQNLLPSAFKKK